MNDLSTRLTPLRYWTTVVFIRLLLLTPLAIGIAIVVAGVRADSVAMTLGGTVVCALGFMIAGTRVSLTRPTDIEPGTNDLPSSEQETLPAGRAAPDTPAVAGLRRLWPILLGACWCVGLFFWQLKPLDDPEILARETEYTFASWLMIAAPLLVILRQCVARRTSRPKLDEPDPSVGLVLGWLVLMVPASFGAIRLGYDADKADTSERRHYLEVLGKQDVRSQQGWKRYRGYYISTRMHAGPIEFKVGSDMFSRLNVGDGMQVSEVTGKSGRHYVTLLGPPANHPGPKSME